MTASVSCAFRGLLALLLVTTALPLLHANAARSSEAEVIWTQDFQAAQGLVEPYYKDDPADAIEWASEGDNRFVRMTLPGKRPLEGFRVIKRPIEGSQLVTVTANVRGQGELLFCLQSANGWIYSPRRVQLTSDWQTVQLSKALSAKPAHLAICALSPSKVQSGAVFEIDDVNVEAHAALPLDDVAVAPVAVEAETLGATQTHTIALPEGGSAIETNARLTLRQILFPQTSQSVHVWLRVRSGSDKNQLLLYSTRPAETRQLIRTLPIKQADGWQWVYATNVTAEEVGPSFQLDLRPKDAKSPIALDRIVFTTQPNIDEAALQQATAINANAPFVRIGRTAEPPTIDGKLDDASWQRTVAVSDFFTFNDQLLPKSPTQVRVTYDDQSLYLAWRCEEPILNVARQQRHEFVAKSKERDKQVLTDESCFLLVHPDTDGLIYEVTVNALGTIADARMPIDALWRGRDLTWNATGIRTATTLEDGYWTLEVAIPFAGLGRSMPQPGERWQVAMARVAQTRSEFSSWNATGSGAHAPRDFGTWAFDDETPGMNVAEPLTALNPGVNTMTLATRFADSRQTGVEVVTKVRSNDAVQRDISVLSASGGKHDFMLKNQNEVTFRWLAMDAATLQPLYRSGVSHRFVRASSAIFTIHTQGDWQLFADGRLVQQGGAGQTDITLSLHDGPNTLALQLPAGKTTLKLNVPGLADQTVRWLRSPVDAAQASEPKRDGRNWPVALEGSADQTLTIDTAEPTTVRHTLLWQDTRVWPKPFPTRKLVAGSAQHINFIANGLSGRALEDWTVFIALPPSVEVSGSTGYYAATVADQPHFVLHRHGDITIDGQAMQLVSVVADKPVKTGRHHRMSIFNLFVNPALDLVGKTVPMVYWTQANGGAVAEPRQTVQLEIMPALQGKQPERFMFYIYGSTFSAMDDPAMREASLATMQAAGITHINDGQRWDVEMGDRYGIGLVRGFNFKSWNLDLRNHLTQHPEHQLLDAKGKRSDSYVCTSHLLDEGWPAIKPLVQEAARQKSPAAFDYDYEYRPLTGPHSCFCERCLTAFRDHAGLSPSVTLDAQIIEQQHMDAWVDFMSGRVAELFAALKAATHEVDPTLIFMAYSGYPTQENAARYGVDWAKVGKLQAVDYAGMGYGRPVAELKRMEQTLPGIPTVLGVLLRPYLTSEDLPPYIAGRARTLRRAIDATGGVLIYDRMPMTGESWRDIAEISRLVAAYEPLFLEARPIDVPGSNPQFVQLLTGDNEHLLCLMNTTSRPLTLNVNVPADLGRGIAFYSKQTTHGSQSLQLTLAPNDVEVFVFKTQ